LPPDIASLRRYTRGCFWLGVNLTNPGVAIYLDAEPLGETGWDRAAQWMWTVLRAPGDIRHELADLATHTHLASIGVEGVEPGRMRVKFYTRLRRAVPLASLGSELLRDPVWGSFLGAVVGPRPMNLSGLVLCFGWDVVRGRLHDVKIDCCAHCLPRSPQAWGELLANLTDGLGVARLPVGPSLGDETAEAAFVGLGLDRDGGRRLNVYLKPTGLAPAEVDVVHLRDRLARAVAYLAGLQADEGYWIDYHLPVGMATGWPTAAVGLAMAEAARVLPGRAAQDAHAAADRAAEWLLRRRPYRAGWGYNEDTGPDADSTAFAIRLLRELGRPVPEHDVAWLLARWSPEGGFSTYPRDDCWGQPHPCVTATGFLALTPIEQASRLDPLGRGLTRWARADGSWPAYWWRTHWYSTFHFGRLIRRLGLAGRFGEHSGVPALEPSPSEFDLAWATGVAVRRGAPQAGDWLTRLLDRQRADGGWRGGWNLRVTDPACAEPWSEPRGDCYLDHRGSITTAAAVTVLTEVLDEPVGLRGPGPSHALLQADVPPLPVDVAPGGLPLPGAHSTGGDRFGGGQAPL
jgi:hypothetical protein